MKFKRKFILAILIVVFGYFTSILFDFLSNPVTYLKPRKRKDSLKKFVNTRLVKKVGLGYLSIG